MATTAKRKPVPMPTGHLTATQAATRSHLDASSVSRWCRKMAVVRLTTAAGFEARRAFVMGRWRWVIERESFMAWVRARRAM